MKTLLAITLFTIFIFTACGQSNVQMQNNTKEKVTSTSTPAEKADKKEAECKVCDFDFENYKGELKKEEIDGLLLALNDEYMAWSIYDQVNEDFGNPRPFTNIQKAEAKHTIRLKSLFEKYKMPIPENKWIGNTPKYPSVIEACKAGVEAEIANRDLYTRLFKTTGREDILAIYKALQRASQENHLPAFQRCGEGRGKRRGRN